MRKKGWICEMKKKKKRRKGGEEKEEQRFRFVQIWADGWQGRDGGEEYEGKKKNKRRRRRGKEE